jgi:hypothetical protein
MWVQNLYDNVEYGEQNKNLFHTFGKALVEIDKGKS